MVFEQLLPKNTNFLGITLSHTSHKPYLQTNIRSLRPTCMNETVNENVSTVLSSKLLVCILLETNYIHILD